jgi:hypothetical protein
MISKALFLLTPFVMSILPLVLYKKNKPFMQKFYLRMIMSFNCRRLYTLVLLLWMIAFHYIAHEVMPGEYGVMISTILMLVFFRFKYADKILHVLHDKRRYAYSTAIATLILMFIPHLYTLSATTGMILLAAVFYPSSSILEKVQNYEGAIRLAKNPATIVEYYY